MVKSCSMFNKDYEVYRDEVSPNNRWLFLNRTGTGFFDPTAYIDLENYVRIDPKDKKKGQVLWKLKYSETPNFQMGLTLGADSEDDGDSHPTVTGVLATFNNVMDMLGDTRFYSMKWRVFSEAQIRSVKVPGGEFTVKMKAKGYATRKVTVYRLKDEKGAETKTVRMQDKEYVTKITYKVKGADGTTIETFELFPGTGDEELVWECGAFRATLRGGWFSNYPHEIVTKPGIDPGFALILAHVCVTEFAPDEIKKDLKPDWHMCMGYIDPYY